ncbi:MAG: hypothetical protein CM15mP74_09000 [Halieaceae bacterium]|nr:MAG: hypothetical protein CM15mP74_09000 [Halieaceae bacterium]
MTQFAAVEGGLMIVFSPGAPEQQLAALERAVSEQTILQPGIPEDSIALESYTAPISRIKPLRGGVWRQACVG